ncbi:F5K24.2-like protein [Hibiscus syriacus]|uniref:F5K24.2-like protein n=1 Tax=Hibiscus syriacus TaxID=106335 RepID=A0A6A3A282_HIBSY|nr:F5K24.2-like protein [Hibiscus syriacus]
MEGISATMYNGLKGYWKRRSYVKLNGSSRAPRSRVELGTSRRKRIVSSGYGGGVANQGIAALGKRPMKEYDQKMIVEIYKSLVIGQGQFVAREPGNLCSAIVCQR